MNQIILQYLREHLDHLLYYNKMAPFPVYDTEYVEEVKNIIMNLLELQYLKVKKYLKEVLEKQVILLLKKLMILRTEAIEMLL